MAELTGPRCQRLSTFLQRLEAATAETGISIATSGHVYDSDHGSYVGSLRQTDDEKYYVDTDSETNA